MMEYKRLLETSECHFNWKLNMIDVKCSKPTLKRLEDKIQVLDQMPYTSFIDKWTLNLCFGYELFLVSEDKKKAIQIVREACEELESADDSLVTKYKSSFEHIAYALLANMLSRSFALDTKEIDSLLSKISQVDKMTNKDLSGLWGIKSSALRYYACGGHNQALTLYRDALQLCPDELEWKLALAVTCTRIRHFNRSKVLTWSDVAEPIQLLSELINSPQIIESMDMACKYFLASNYKDFLCQNLDSPEADRIRRELNRLCHEIIKSGPKSPQIICFCSLQLLRSRLPEDAASLMKAALAMYPLHVGINVTAGSIFQYIKRLSHLTEKHYRIAYEQGGYGAAWRYLDCISTKLCRGPPINYEDFFEDLLKRHPDLYRAQTHLNASLFYFFSQRDLVNGCRHVQMALKTDCSFEGLKNCFCWRIHRIVNPLELAYNQCRLGLTQPELGKHKATLKEIEFAIDSHTDTTNFDRERDLVKVFISEHNYTKRGKQLKIESFEEDLWNPFTED